MPSKVKKPLEGAFDPYHIWLGIPRKNQPPNHYCLLGIEPFEESGDAISNAADQRMAHLRQYQAGPHSALSQQLLNEVAAAKLCLLEPAKKAAYDRAMQEKLGPAKAEVGRSHTNPKRERGRQVPSSLTLPVSVTDDCERDNDETPMPEPAEDVGFEIERLLGREDLGPSSQPRHLPKERSGRLVKLGIGGGLAVLAVVGFVLWQCTHHAPREGLHHAERDEYYEIHHADRAGMVPGDACNTSTDPAPNVEGIVVAKSSMAPAGDSGSKPSPPALPKGEGSKVQKAIQEPARSTPNDFDELVGAVEEPQKTSLRDVAKPPPKAAPPAATGKLPPPSVEAQREIAGRLGEELGLAEAKTAEAKLRRAEVLFRMNERFVERPNERFVVLRTIADFAGQGGDVSLVMAAVDATAGQFQMDARKAKESLLRKFAAGPATAARIRSFVRGSRSVIDQAVAAGDFQAALGLANLACQLCQTAQGKEYRREAIERRAGVQNAAEQRQQIQAAEETLQKDPENGQANLLLGRWYCTAEKDWIRGIRCLARAADAEVQAIARQDMASSSADGEQAAKMGDAWWDLAQSRPGQDRALCLSRAGFWYHKAAEGMPAGLLRMRTEKRLADLRSEHLPL